jgi:hypothetical protein
MKKAGGIAPAGALGNSVGLLVEREVIPPGIQIRNESGCLTYLKRSNCVYAEQKVPVRNRSLSKLIPKRQDPLRFLALDAQLEESYSREANNLYVGASDDWTIGDVGHRRNTCAFNLRTQVGRIDRDVYVQKLRLRGRRRQRHCRRGNKACKTPRNDSHACSPLLFNDSQLLTPLNDIQWPNRSLKELATG